MNRFATCVAILTLALQIPSPPGAAAGHGIRALQSSPQIRFDWVSDLEGEESARAAVRTESGQGEVLEVVLLDAGGRELSTWSVVSDGIGGGTEIESLGMPTALGEASPLIWLVTRTGCGSACYERSGTLLRVVERELVRVWDGSVGWHDVDGGMEEDAEVVFRAGGFDLRFPDRIETITWSPEDGEFFQTDLTTLEDPAETHPSVATEYAEALWERLIEAAGAGDPGWLRELLKLGADPARADFVDNYARAPLLSALRAGHLEAAQILLEAGSDPEIPVDVSGRTPLMEAAARGDRTAVDLLLEHGADPNTSSSEDDLTEQGDMLVVYHTSLSLAAVRGHAAVVQTLLEAGADPGIGVGPEGTRSVLELARAAGRAEVVRTLEAWPRVHPP